jgi:hypothetical protein
MRSPAAAALLATLTFAAPLAAHAGSKTREQTKIVGYSANASWDYVAGNIGTFVNVIVTQNDLSGTTGPAQDAFVSLAISQYEVDTSNVLITGVAYVQGAENFQFTVDKDLGTATLRAHDAIFQDDNSFTFFNVDIDLTWTTSGEPTTANSQYREKIPGMKLNTHFTGLFRDGVASGTIVGKNILFTPVPSNSAQLQFNRFGSNSITTVTP